MLSAATIMIRAAPSPWSVVYTACKLKDKARLMTKQIGADHRTCSIIALHLDGQSTSRFSLARWAQQKSINQIDPRRYSHFGLSSFHWCCRVFSQRVTAAEGTSQRKANGRSAGMLQRKLRLVKTVPKLKALSCIEQIRNAAIVMPLFSLFLYVLRATYTRLFVL